jgi:hypothetical protein
MDSVSRDALQKCITILEIQAMSLGEQARAKHQLAKALLAAGSGHQVEGVKIQGEAQALRRRLENEQNDDDESDEAYEYLVKFSARM